MAEEGNVARCMVCKKNPAKLGGKRYCYTTACYDTGVERGHIVPRGSHSKRPRGASAAGASGAPQPQQMGRSSPPPEMPSTGISSIWEIHALYGFRRVPPHLRAACSR